MRRDSALLAADDDADSFVAAVARKTEQVEALRLEVDDLSALLARTRTELADAIRHVSVVRYDAFGDMGGRLSFSAAMLDDGGDGLVLTSIHGRAETRSYIKGVKSGTSEASLSPEEQQAITLRPARGVVVTSIAYLGPRGTFTEEALRSMAVSEGAELRPLATAEAVLDAVRSGEVDHGLVAIENSIEGGVTAHARQPRRPATRS